MTKICLDCFERCTTGTSTGQFAAHAPIGIADYSQPEVELSLCCEHDWKEVDSDLVDWHESFIFAAKEAGQKWMTYADPERYKEEFNEGIPPEEAFKEVVKTWSTTIV